MTGPSLDPIPDPLDLDALREKAERATADPLYIAAVSSDVILAVLALVEEQRARISALEEALRGAPAINRWAAHILAGSPAENKEPT